MKRSLLSDLIRWKNKTGRKPLLLQGARQVGKTTLLQQFGREHFPAFHILNFEKDIRLEQVFAKNLDPLHILRELEFLLQHSINPHQDLVIFDEVQACPRALTSLKYFAEEMPQLALAAAGSLLGVFLSPASFPVGKVDMITLYPMSFEEFLLAMDDRLSLDLLRALKRDSKIPEMAHLHLFEQLKYYFVVGGLPEVVYIFCQERENLLNAFRKVREKQNSLVDAYLADFAKHSGKVNAMHIARIWHAVPAQLARSQDGSGAKFKFKGVVPGVDRYNRLAGAIDWLEAARLVIKVPIVNSGRLPFSAYASETVFKLYLFDVGILGAISDLKPETILQYDYGSYKGYFAENYIAQALLTKGFHSLYSWQEKQAEVEFLFEEDGHAIPLEIKSGWVLHAKSAQIFAEKYHSPFRVIFSAQNLNITPSVHRYPIYLAGWFPLTA